MIEEFTKEKILSEVEKLQYLYGLKYEMRYNHIRNEEFATESVAEHIYSLHVLALYFLPLEDPEGKWNRARIMELITVHDFDEIETGDTIGYLKTDAQRAKEADAARKVIEKSPEHLKDKFSELISEYESQITPEAKFVKALDRFEPSIFCLTEHGKKTLLRNHTTPEQSYGIKRDYVAPYPYLKAFAETIHEKLIADGHFWLGN